MPKNEFRKSIRDPGARNTAAENTNVLVRDVLSQDVQFVALNDLVWLPATGRMTETVYCVFDSIDENTQGTFIGLLMESELKRTKGARYRDCHITKFIDPPVLTSTLSSAVERMEIESCNALPVVDAHGNLAGVITHLSIIKHLLDQASRTNGSAIVRTETSARVGELNKALGKLLGVLSRPHSVDFLQRGIEAVALVLQVDHGAVNLIDDRGVSREAFVTGNKLLKTKSPARFLEQRQPLLDEVIKTNVPLRIDDVARYMKNRGNPIFYPTLRTFLGIPISHNDHVYGALYFCDALNGRPFTEADETFATTFAQGIALLYAQSRERKERKVLEDRLREQERQYRLLVNELDAIVWELESGSGQVKFISKGSEALLGYSRNMFLEAGFWDSCVHADDRDRFSESRKHAAMRGIEYDLEYRCMTKAGRIIWLHDIVRAVSNGEADHPQVLGLSVDITQRKRDDFEKGLLSDLASRLVSSDTLEKLSVAMAETLSQLWDWETLSLYIPRAGKSRFACAYIVKRNEGNFMVQASNTTPELLDHKDLLQGRPLVINRMVGDEALSPLPFHERSSSRYGSFLFIPAATDNELLGLFELHASQFGTFREDDVALPRRIASSASPALARCLAELRSAAFSALGYQMSIASTPEEAGRVIVNIADSLFGLDSCSLYLYSERNNTSYSIFHVDVMDGVRREIGPEDPLPPRPGPLGQRAIEEGAHLVLREKPEFDYSNPLPFGDIARPSASLMFVPLRNGKRVIGVFSVQSYTRNAYSQKDLELLQALADHGAPAFERTWNQLHGPLTRSPSPLTHIRKPRKTKTR